MLSYIIVFPVSIAVYSILKRTIITEFPIKNGSNDKLYEGKGRLRLIRRGEVKNIAGSKKLHNNKKLSAEEISGKITSLIKNTRRLSYLEEELSSHFRSKTERNKLIRELVCQLKICTSRLKSDISELESTEK
jgi:hypothetical protein